MKGESFMGLRFRYCFLLVLESIYLCRYKLVTGFDCSRNKIDGHSFSFESIDPLICRLKFRMIMLSLEDTNTINIVGNFSNQEIKEWVEIIDKFWEWGIEKMGYNEDIFCFISEEQIPSLVVKDGGAAEVDQEKEKDDVNGTGNKKPQSNTDKIKFTISDEEPTTSSQMASFSDNFSSTNTLDQVPGIQLDSLTTPAKTPTKKLDISTKPIEKNWLPCQDNKERPIGLPMGRTQSQEELAAKLKAKRDKSPETLRKEKLLANLGGVNSKYNITADQFNTWFASNKALQEVPFGSVNGSKRNNNVDEVRVDKSFRSPKIGRSVSQNLLTLPNNADDSGRQTLNSIGNELNSIELKRVRVELNWTIESGRLN